MTRLARLDRVLECLRQRRAEARDRYGVEFVGVVGSTARGEAHESSDVDVLINVVGHTTYFRIGELEAELGAQLGAPVDLVDRKCLRPAFRADMERDLVSI
ncbi:MAG TPA: nucleotidyltransferase domain-containing protein [Caulobacteraceae bacterium]|nr:nucleotidyltransferase domain-containing protein [Caulobacteraceae bacterium]